ncbi:MAG: ADP-glyceromanno-heptose 6-epimerase [Gammaproteobacteria bacterium]|nr:MAG: ADP-glyceromanno-heptose 6-epimerase [Gammaproteobacteria bacterium]RLA15894.1 MAG: ADP-glyceromanno-heptose 6-epimerase [Gammaproteobacteria bacterium]RLA17526.1 MAG: ADP-glyceromanno-heptose 6-epimerase [Gammaproteobacteria bacterium]
MEEKIIVTGGAGFIGSNIVRGLNQRGYGNVVVVDNLGNNSEKFANLVDCEVADFIDKQDFIPLLESEFLNDNVTAVFHQGACSDTMELDGRYMMANNYQYSKAVLHACQQAAVPMMYASSASVYGDGQVFSEERFHEGPLNVYGYSKFLFDQYVRRHRPSFTAQVTGFRYFNVYGPGEQHKGRMASVAYHFFNQFTAQGYLNLFKGSHGYENGCQRRDFIHVDDVVAVNLHCLENSELSGIFNLGTGKASAFNDVALAVVNFFAAGQSAELSSLDSAIEKGLIRYIDFPAGLEQRYQSFTEADMQRLKHAGYKKSFKDVPTGVGEYLQKLENS